MAGPDAGTDYTLRLERRFAAERERVFHAFTDEAALRQWYAPGEAVVVLMELDVRVGGVWRVHMRGPDGTLYRLRCEYREVTPPSRLVFTWRWEHAEDAVDTLVTVEFEAEGEATVVRLTHEGFGSEQDRAGHAQGWEATFEKLATLL